MGGYDSGKQGMPAGALFRWPLVIGGAVVAIAAVCAGLPDRDPGPDSVTVVGVTAPLPAFGSYPGLRVPVARPPQAGTHYRT